jgi:hypothetical protein
MKLAVPSKYADYCDLFFGLLFIVPVFFNHNVSRDGSSLVSR